MRRESLQRIKYVLVDFLSLNLAILFFNIARFYLLPDPTVGYDNLLTFLSSKAILFEQALLPLLLLGVCAISGYYNRPLLKSRIQEFVSTVLTSVVLTIIVFLALLTNQVTSVRATNFELLSYLFLLLWGLMYLGRYLVTAHAYRKFRSGHWLYNVIVVGRAAEAREMFAKLSEKRAFSGITPSKVVEVSQTAYSADIDYKELEQYCRQEEVREIYFVTESISEPDLLRVIYALIPLGLPIKVSAESLSILNSNIRLQNIYEEPYIDVMSASLSDSSKNIKRCFDVIMSGLAITVLSVPMLIVAMLVKRDSPGSVFFSQERIGRRRKPFKIYKFRSMHIDAEAQGPMLSSEDDPRVTKVGRWMRKYRIDELPQLWNVLKGDMSIVGPRPERMHFIKQIMEQAPYYSLVHQVRPGITSWGMVKYGYASGVSQMIERLRYDLVYLANMSVTNDLKIIIYTVKTVIKGRGM